MPYDIFISYSRRDNADGRITQLVERIKKDFAPFAKRELVPFFDQQEIHGMQDWRQRILQGLRESRLLLACLSPAYLKSEYCEWEFVEYLKYEIGHLHGFNGVAPIYFVEVPGWDSKGFEQQCAAWVAELRKRQYFDLRPWHDQGEEALREAAVQERMGRLNEQIAKTISRGERAEKSLGNVDAHNPHFIGRTANLRMLRENFVTPGHIGVVTAVNGVGGLGKTALAIEYAHAFADEYGGGRWQVRCAGKDDLRLALAELATPIGFEFTDDEKKNADLQFERTRRELKKLADARAPHRCLLLLDNVDRPGLLDPAQVARLNGGDWLHVLATTRLGENELHGAHRDRSFLAIDELPPDDALALIESYQPDGRFRSEAERDAAREIVRLLGSFTLAVESAAVYLGQFTNDVTCAAFLARLKKEGLEGLDTAASQSSEGVLHGEKRLSATLQPTLERLGAAEKLALEFAALLPPDQVPLPWLRALVAKTFPEIERDAEPGYPDPWKNVLRRLFSMRLIQATDAMDTDGQPRVVRVHRLVQELTKHNCSESDRAVRQQAVDVLVTERDAVLLQATNWVDARWELEPFAALADLWDEMKHPEAAWLLNQTGARWTHLAEWGKAEPLMRRMIAVCENKLGSSHPSFASALNNLAQLLKATCQKPSR
ncbi:MAG: TIR domain-containing protein [Verrucomicrobia bacterium]|nr:TIR domain-containing protein [Verrucomicrobiota bacterium]